MQERMPVDGKVERILLLLLLLLLIFFSGMKLIVLKEGGRQFHGRLKLFVGRLRMDGDGRGTAKDRHGLLWSIIGSSSISS